MSDLTEAAQRRAAALEQRRDNLIEALQLERSGYVQRGSDDRVAQVDKQIAWAKSSAFGESAPVVDSTQDADTIAEKTAGAAAVAAEVGESDAAAVKPSAKPAAKKPAARKPAAKKG